MGLHWQINQGTMIHQYTNTLAIKVRAPLFDGHNDSKQLTFMGWVVTGGTQSAFCYNRRLAATTDPNPGSKPHQCNNLRRLFLQQSHRTCWVAQGQGQSTMLA